jgi:hypothetical protein
MTEKSCQIIGFDYVLIDFRGIIVEIFTKKPEGYCWNIDNMSMENFSIDFIEPSLSDRCTEFIIKLGDYGFTHMYEFEFSIEKMRHSIEQLCFGYTKAWIDFGFDETVTRLDCEAVSKWENGSMTDLIRVTIIPNGYVREYNKIENEKSVEDGECSPLGGYTAYVDAKDFIKELYTKIMKIADGEYDGGALSPEIFREKFKSGIIEKYLSNGKIEIDDSRALPR